MPETIRIGALSIQVTRKPVKHVHLSVHPPHGRVTLTAPTATRLDVARAYAISRLGWIEVHQRRMGAQAREAQRQFVERETHYLWGRRLLMTVEYQEEKPSVIVDHKRLNLKVRPGSDAAKRAEILHEWHKGLLHAVVPELIRKWEKTLKVRLAGYSLQRMKTKWGSCNPRARSIRLNTELVKKPKDLLEYVVVHELVHLLEPKHSERFLGLMDKHYPTWREARAELNELPLGSEAWKE